MLLLCKQEGPPHRTSSQRTAVAAGVMDTSTSFFYLPIAGKNKNPFRCLAAAINLSLSLSSIHTLSYLSWWIKHRHLTRMASTSSGLFDRTSHRSIVCIKTCTWQREQTSAHEEGRGGITGWFEPKRRVASVYIACFPWHGNTTVPASFG